jgi:pimeloyl-ACP methyl ester carboxylesterase
VALVFLHGIGSGPEAWQPQVEAFAGERVVVALRVPFDLASASEALDGLEEAEDELLDLCGISWGGLVALRYALEHPERVQSLTVTAAFASLPARLRVLRLVMSLAVRVVPRAPHQLARPMREGARFDVRDRIGSLRAPTLVLCGERDRLNLPLSRTLARAIPHARFAVVPDAGHAANVDNPDEFNRLLAEFLPPVP